VLPALPALPALPVLLGRPVDPDSRSGVPEEHAATPAITHETILADAFILVMTFAPNLVVHISQCRDVARLIGKSERAERNSSAGRGTRCRRWKRIEKKRAAEGKLSDRHRT
jgi:hypothetical protein